MKPLEQIPLPIAGLPPATESVYQDDLLGGPSRLIRAASRRAPRRVSVAISMDPLPLLESVQGPRLRGRPSQRPAGFPADIWGDWRRSVGRGAEDTPEGLARWLTNHVAYCTLMRSRMGWHLEHRATPGPRVIWVTVIPPRSLTMEQAAEWRRRISRTRGGEPIYRISPARGLQVRKVVA